ncbi:ABC transporter ATP-binding protein [Brevibacterium jeotgali]|uniref:Putative ABC transport system ATP-binding protein n=1 Tax=Brevibacterium jeotgali TaxID=1262550 RepID=A0A2H1L507_9MICO|nr:ABC transporter ATP-binding protein [Brevibacterium jeotgali]TWC01419.1 putative ABC transport system ATP-binding protein [Brevibacterium jeotgali]SMY11976.1 putative ABC transport system ATP-binding protein [Brevibacterium jeotgali]
MSESPAPHPGPRPAPPHAQSHAQSHAQPPAPVPAPLQAPAPAAEAALAARALVKEYGPTRALAGVDLDVPRGQSLAIMGPSGSGKSTLLHVLAGMVLPDSGAVHLQPNTPGHVDVTSLTPDQRTRLRRERFGFVFQQGLLLPELTAEENVAVAAMLAGASRARATAAARSWLAGLGLAEHAHKRIGQLSGGQAQRVAVARAQITEPEVVFADEPTGALDSHTSAVVLGLLLETTVDRGRTLVMVTHDETVAATCARTVRLSDGLVVADTARGAR